MIILAALLLWNTPSQACCPNYSSNEYKSIHYSSKNNVLVTVKYDGSMEEYWTWRASDPSFRWVAYFGTWGGGLAREGEFGVLKIKGKPPKNVERVLEKLVEHAPNALVKAKQMAGEAFKIQADYGAKLLGAVEIEESSGCDLKFRKKGKALRVTVYDSKTRSNLPVAEFEDYNRKNCEYERAGKCQSYSYDSKKHFAGKCYRFKKGLGALVVSSKGMSGICSEFSAQDLLLYRDSDLEYLRNNIYGFRKYKKKEYENAIKFFKKSLEGNSEYHHANFNLACTNSLLKKPFSGNEEYLDRLLNGDEAKCKRYWKKINTDKDLDYWRKKDATYKAWIADKRKNLECLKPPLAQAEKAEKKKEKDRNLNPHQIEARAINRDGMRAYLKKDYKKAIQFFAQAMKKDRDFVLARTNLASVYGLQSNARSAVSVLSKALPKNPKMILKKMKTDKDYDPIRKTRDFKKLLKKAEKWAKKSW